VVRPCSHREAGAAQSSVRVQPAWWQARAVAWRRPGEVAAARARAFPSAMKGAEAAAAVALSAQQVASAQQVLPPAEAVAARSGATVQPRVEAGVSPGPSVQPPAAAEVEEAASDEQARPREAAVSDAAGVQPPEAAEVALDVVAEPQRAEAAEGLPDVPEQRPGAAAQEPAALPPVAEHPSALPSGHREGHPLPWLARRQSVRSAPAKPLSRTASPSKQS